MKKFYSNAANGSAVENYSIQLSFMGKIYFLLISCLLITSSRIAVPTNGDQTPVTIASAVKKSYNGSNISCATAKDGQITVTAAGGTGVYEYSKDNGATYQSGKVISGFAAAIYQVRVKDANGCIATSS